MISTTQNDTFTPCKHCSSMEEKMTICYENLNE